MAFQFPQVIYNQLDGIDLKLLNEISFLSRLQRKRTGSAYCCPGRQYLADKLDIDVGTVSRHTSKLVALGVLDKRQRRRVRGVWQTCLYKLRSWQAWTLGQIAGLARKIGRVPHRVRPDAHKLSCERKIEASEAKSPPQNRVSREIYERWRAKGLLPPTS